ncbi:MAG: NifX-associated nitrogen fixation protein [Magnetospirillum sp.]|nr:MAG: NifX-associated nitrogen fixation protein [Magnetospirillum sp.]
MANAYADPFIKSLLMLIRAHDGSGAWETVTDEEVIAPFIVTKEQRREIPLIGDPDPDILWRVELFYNAIGMAIEKQTGCACAPIMKINHEGWGRMLLTSGRLVVINSYLRDLHRFGFDSVEALTGKAGKIIEDGVATIGKFPDVAAA